MVRDVNSGRKLDSGLSLSLSSQERTSRKTLKFIASEYSYTTHLNLTCLLSKD